MDRTIKTTFKEVVSKYKYFIFDCDGVLYHGKSPVGSAFENIRYMHT